jgi:hypothetical protein
LKWIQASTPRPMIVTAISNLRTNFTCIERAHPLGGSTVQ